MNEQPIRVTCAVLHTDEHGNTIPCPGYPHADGPAEAALRRVRAACDQLHGAAVLDDGQPHTDRERGVIQAVNRIVAALNDDTSSKENRA